MRFRLVVHVLIVLNSKTHKKVCEQTMRKKISGLIQS